MPPIRMTTALAKVVAALLHDPTAEHYGLELMRATGHPSGTLYPILVRLEAAGWVSTRWEEIDAAEAGRPPRRYYRLTAEGVVAARQALAELRLQLDPGASTVTKPRGATA
ncbi:PadR family transcriptional regulator [Dactylosporangium aurantiacum]|uniref:PadR family transcriptional regulator n=1 Tax=Dactylosporangium aurantiacum TaxID=35754 RepID=A0A9Q9MID7_9ACTN|nr:PadR family transcriptional regulator [Dactylosporangium aurantiacum]MDG6106712.1 PadR family transcriptional regulator [Dactylosporangium aurantiacum]UWZ50862.1 PadR family transcriptional regulator [Dactylosporangium aurantiacum]